MQTTTSVRNLVGLIGWKNTCKAADKAEKKIKGSFSLFVCCHQNNAGSYRSCTGMYPL